MAATAKLERPARRTVAAALAGAALLWGGCSVEEHYELLAFFFDGVPEPDPAAARTGESGSIARSRSVAPTSYHAAYIERRCAECHGDKARFGFTSTGFEGLGDPVCLPCHAEVSELPRLHGPLAAQLCLPCHEPHVSVHRTLLRDRSPALCMSCHEPEFQGERSPPHTDLERDCLDCHAAHGGADRYYLRPGVLEQWAPPPLPGAERPWPEP